LADCGFDERVARLQGLYGAGSYFADALCKANQYAVPNGDGERCVFYCRVTVGAPYRTNTTHLNLRRPEENPATPGKPYDSIFAETGVAQAGGQVHNEYVIFNGNQVLPEYIIWYKI
jgi:hypothetical protein